MLTAAMVLMHDLQLVNNLGISGNSRVVNVLRDHTTHNNDGLAPEMYAALESIEQRLRVVHSQELGMSTSESLDSACS